MIGVRLLIPGLAVVGLMAALAWTLGSLVPLVGAPVLALVAAVIIRNAAQVPATLRPGVDFTLKRLLRAAIILFGATLSLVQVLQIGAGSFAVIFVTILMALGLTWLFGRWLHAPSGRGP